MGAASIGSVSFALSGSQKHTIHLIEKSRPLGQTLAHSRDTRNICARRRGNRLEVIRSD